MEDLISIVIPAFNRAYCIGRTIESCLKQSYGNIEIIICDDSSTDDTLEIIKSYALKDSRVKFVINNLGKGAQYARECAIKISNGKYIAFMDSDDILTETSIEDRYRCFLENDVDMVYGDILVEDKENPLRVYFDNLNDLTIERRRKYLLEELSLCAFITIMIKKELFDTGEIVLNKKLPAWQDDDLVLSVGFTSGKFYHCGKAVAMVCNTGDNISAHYDNKLKGLKILFELYKDRIVNMSRSRVLLWKLRILLDCFGVKMQTNYAKNRKFMAFFYRCSFFALNNFLSLFFRHIYG